MFALNWLLALATAGLLVLCFPPFDLVWLAPFALTPLLVALSREPRPRFRFLLGYLAGIPYWFFLCRWIQFVLEYHGGMGPVGGWAVFILFCLAKALHMGVFAVLAAPLLRHWFAVPAVAALWAAIERTHGDLGFQWLTLGNAAADMGVPLRLAPFTGTYGVSFVFVLMAMSWLKVAQRRPRHYLPWLAGAAALLFVLPPLPDATPGTEQAIVLQPNLNPETEYNEASLRRLVGQLTDLTLRSARRTDAPVARLMVWPEVPAPFYYHRDAGFREAVVNLAADAKAALLVGTVSYTNSGSPLNSAILLNDAGWLTGQYDKVNLVPFGEFVPPLFGFVNRITTEISDFVPGTGPEVMSADRHRVGTFICYESVFPDYVRRFSALGAEVLVNVSNDGYFGRSAAYPQHLRLVRMRAVENRRWVLRATNDGFTVAIDPAGRIAAEVPAYRRLAARLPYQPRRDLTLYARWGDWFVVGCAVVAIAALFVSQVPRYVPPAAEKQDG